MLVLDHPPCLELVLVHDALHCTLLLRVQLAQEAGERHTGPLKHGGGARRTCHRGHGEKHLGQERQRVPFAHNVTRLPVRPRRRHRVEGSLRTSTPTAFGT